MNAKGLVLGLICTSVFFAGAAYMAQEQGKDVTVSWDANTESDLAGYKVYRGTTSRDYDQAANVGNVTAHTWLDLPAGTYYFAVTAYDAAGNESDFSDEVSITIEPDQDTMPPAPPQNVRVVIEGNTAIIRFDYDTNSVDFRTLAADSL